MKILTYLIFFISTIGYGQIDPDSTELIKTQLRIDSLKVQLDSLKSESEKTQILIDRLKQENTRLTEWMKLYMEQINCKEEKEMVNQFLAQGKNIFYPTVIQNRIEASNYRKNEQKS